MKMTSAPAGNAYKSLVAEEFREWLRLTPPPQEPEIPEACVKQLDAEAAVRLDSERWKIRVDLWKGQVEAWKAAASILVEANKQGFAYARLAITNAILINGAACVALLSFLSALYVKAEPARPAVLAALIQPVLVFAAGAAAAGVGAGCGAIASRADMKLRFTRVTIYSWLAGIFVGGSFIAFCAGLYSAFQVFATIAK